MAARKTAAALALGLALAAASGAAAQDQDAAPTAPMAVLTLDKDRLFSGSRFGARTIEAVEEQARALQAENRRIEADLEAEEKSLTERRSALSPEAFRTEADAFDAKVKGIRAAQEAKARDLAAQRDAARQVFLQASAPVLAQILQERGAVAILDRSAIILSFDRADVTDLAIARIDSVLVDGAAPDGTDPAPEATSGTPAPAEVPPAPPEPAAPAPGP
jgi:Skp family chaperone for outer membrane proteins